MAQNGPKRHAHVPFLDILVFGKKLLPKKGHAKKKQFYNIFQMHKNYHTIHAHKNMKKISSPNLPKCYHFVIIFVII